ncbi:MAG: 16S rRNA processing protein RimM [Acidimicrobiia bacterium]|nr:16S rRNA processing protein RimM [Acidimicrobiia bacterium]
MTEAPHLEVGRIGRAHGLRGEVNVTLTSDREERVAPGSVLRAGDRSLVVATSRRHQKRWIVLFEGVDGRNAAEALTGTSLEAELLPGDNGEMWVHELVGSAVFDPQDQPIGTVVAVEANPASDLLVVSRAEGASEVLIPLNFVVASGDGRIVADVPEGLLEING